MDKRFQMSADAKVIRSVLEEKQVGEVATYGEMSTAIGRDVRLHAYAAMRTAMRALQRDKQIVFANVTDVGYQRLNDVGIVDSMEADRKKMARASGRALKKLECAKFEALPPDKQRSHTIAAAQMGALQMFAKATTTKKIGGSLVDPSKPMAIGETLKLFGS